MDEEKGAPAPASGGRSTARSNTPATSSCSSKSVAGSFDVLHVYLLGLLTPPSPPPRSRQSTRTSRLWRESTKKTSERACKHFGMHRSVPLVRSSAKSCVSTRLRRYKSPASWSHQSHDCVGSLRGALGTSFISKDKLPSAFAACRATAKPSVRTRGVCS